MSSVQKSPEELITLATEALEAAGVTRANAAPVARALVAADLDGLASHGLARLPFYADQAAAGKVDGHAEPRIVQNGAVVNVDARDGFAYRAIADGLDTGLPLVRETGVAAVAVGNSHHFGVAGHHVERAARDGVCALALGNTPAAIAPWGGYQPLFGTNPLAFAAPRANADPLILDLSLSKVARGKVMMAHKQGEPIPEGWALDAQGNPTTDAAEALAGSMVPLGEAKGSALALMVELLTAGLTGSSLGFEASSFFDAEGAPPRVAQLFILFDPARFGGREVFASRMETLVDAITSQEGTRLPGERRLALRNERAGAPLEVPSALVEDLQRRCGR